MAVVASRKLTIAEIEVIKDAALDVLQEGAVEVSDCQAGADWWTTYDIQQQDGSRFTGRARCRTEAASQLSRSLMCSVRQGVEDCGQGPPGHGRTP
jgi:hypothetical protein